MTIGWKRGGGSNIFIPKEWPAISETITMKRNAPYSYMMNVCTHSYSLVWYSWNDWERFIDWMALGLFNFLCSSLYWRSFSIGYINWESIGRFNWSLTEFYLV